MDWRLPRLFLLFGGRTDIYLSLFLFALPYPGSSSDLAFLGPPCCPGFCLIVVVPEHVAEGSGAPAFSCAVIFYPFSLSLTRMLFHPILVVPSL